MKLQIFHSVNAGLYLWNGRSGLLIDCLHGGRGTGFSDTPVEYVQMMRDRREFFAQKNDILLTHTHPDHYDSALTEEFLRLNPDSVIYAPGLDRSSVQPVVLETGISLLRIRDYEIYAFSTEHDGSGYAGYPHCSYLIRWNGQSLWVSGDALLEPELAGRVLKRNDKRAPEAAFVMVYQVGQSAGKQFLRELSPEKIWLYHLPYPEDDAWNHRALAENIVRRCNENGIPVRILPEDSYV